MVEDIFRAFKVKNLYYYLQTSTLVNNCDANVIPLF